MKQYMRVAGGMVLVLMFSAIALSADAADPEIGTWVLNVEKSKFSGVPHVKSLKRTYEPTADGQKIIIEGVTAEGETFRSTFTVKYDGKDYATPESPIADTVSLRRVDKLTTETVQKKDGKVVSKGTRVISRDGKTLTHTATGTTAKGEPFKNVLVFEKQ